MRGFMRERASPQPSRKEQQRVQLQANEKDPTRRKKFAFMRYSPDRRSSASMHRSREHARQIALQLDTETGNSCEEFPTSFDHITPAANPSPLSAPAAPQHFSIDPAFSVNVTQRNRTTHTTAASSRRPPRNKPALDQFVERHAPTSVPNGPFESSSLQNPSSSQWQGADRTVNSMPTFPSNSTMQSRNTQRHQSRSPQGMPAGGGAAARRRMRNQQRQSASEVGSDSDAYQSQPFDETPPQSPQTIRRLGSGGSVGSGSHRSSNGGRTTNHVANYAVSHPRHAIGEGSGRSSSSSNSSDNVFDSGIDGGFTFDAFGLDGSQIGREVDEAMQEIGRDFSAVLDQSDEFAPQHWDSPAGSRRSTPTPESDQDGFVDGFRISRPNLPPHIRHSPANSERSSLSSRSSDRHNNQEEERGNVFKEKAGFFTSSNKQVIGPVSMVRQSKKQQKAEQATNDQLNDLDKGKNSRIPPLPTLERDQGEEAAAAAVRRQQILSHGSEMLLRGRTTEYNPENGRRQADPPLQAGRRETDVKISDTNHFRNSEAADHSHTEIPNMYGGMAPPQAHSISADLPIAGNSDSATEQPQAFNHRKTTASIGDGNSRFGMNRSVPQSPQKPQVSWSQELVKHPEKSIRNSTAYSAHDPSHGADVEQTSKLGFRETTSQKPSGGLFIVDEKKEDEFSKVGEIHAIDEQLSPGAANMRRFEELRNAAANVNQSLQAEKTQQPHQGQEFEAGHSKTFASYKERLRSSLPSLQNEEKDTSLRTNDVNDGQSTPKAKVAPAVPGRSSQVSMVMNRMSEISTNNQLKSMHDASMSPSYRGMHQKNISRSNFKYGAKSHLDSLENDRPENDASYEKSRTSQNWRAEQPQQQQQQRMQHQEHEQIPQNQQHHYHHLQEEEKQQQQMQQLQQQQQMQQQQQQQQDPALTAPAQGSTNDAPSPRKMTYRERRELELRQQQEEREKREGSQETKEPPKRDVAQLIRRRIAANKKTAVVSPAPDNNESGANFAAAAKGRLKKTQTESSVVPPQYSHSAISPREEEARRIDFSARLRPTPKPALEKQQHAFDDGILNVVEQTNGSQNEKAIPGADNSADMLNHISPQHVISPRQLSMQMNRNMEPGSEGSENKMMRSSVNASEDRITQQAGNEMQSRAGLLAQIAGQAKDALPELEPHDFNYAGYAAQSGGDSTEDITEPKSPQHRTKESPSLAEISQDSRTHQGSLQIEGSGHERITQQPAVSQSLPNMGDLLAEVKGARRTPQHPGLESQSQSRANLLADVIGARAQQQACHEPEVNKVEPVSLSVENQGSRVDEVTTHSDSPSESKSKTPKATVAMLNAFLHGRETMTDHDAPETKQNTEETEGENANSSNPPSPARHASPKHVSDDRPALKDDPKYSRYFRMLKIGMPLDVVKHAMTRDGLDASVMDGDHNKPVCIGVPLKNDPKYQKYFKMLMIGLPLDAVKHAMERDGLDSSVMDQDHNLPATAPKAEKEVKKERDTHRRARLHWKTLRKVRSNSVWAKIDQDLDLDNVEIDDEEFEELFKAEHTQVAPKSSGATNKRGAAVRVIDPKRANNGGIILARLKMTHDDMAEVVERIDDKAMSAEQIEHIIEYLPTKEERKALEEYMLEAGQDAAEKFMGLCECEKFMVSMMTVKHAKRKVRALLFKLQFDTCLQALADETQIVEKACDELSNSTRLRQLLGIVLTFGNRLNTAGNGKRKVGAFTLDSLLKLNQAKAFDKKTTFLHYIVLIVQRNNELLLKFRDDLPTALKADKVYWDQCVADLEEVENQLENVRRIALYQARLAQYRQKRKKHHDQSDDESLSEVSLSLEEEVEALRATPIGVFTLDAIKKVSYLRDKVDGTRSKFARLLEYFGEDDKSMQPHELFNIIVRFVDDFDKAKEQVSANAKRKMREERKRQASANRTKNSNGKPPSPLLRASNFQPDVGKLMKESRKNQESSHVQNESQPKSDNALTSSKQTPNVGQQQQQMNTLNGKSVPDVVREQIHTRGVQNEVELRGSVNGSGNNSSRELPGNFTVGCAENDLPPGMQENGRSFRANGAPEEMKSPRQIETRTSSQVKFAGPDNAVVHDAHAMQHHATASQATPVRQEKAVSSLEVTSAPSECRTPSSVSTESSLRRKARMRRQRSANVRASPAQIKSPSAVQKATSHEQINNVHPSINNNGINHMSPARTAASSTDPPGMHSRHNTNRVVQNENNSISVGSSQLSVNSGSHASSGFSSNQHQLSPRSSLRNKRRMERRSRMMAAASSPNTVIQSATAN